MSGGVPGIGPTDPISLRHTAAIIGRRLESQRRPLLGSPLAERAARWGVVAWSAIGLAILGFWAYRYLVYPVRVIFPPLVVATVIVFLLNPVVTRIERRGIPRIWGTLASYVVFLTVVGVALALLVPVVSRQVTNLVENVPELLDQAQRELQGVSERTGVSIGLSDLFGQLQASQGRALGFVGRITSFTAGVLHAAVILILGPIIAFYLLVDYPKVTRWVKAAIPARRRGEVQLIGERLSYAVGGFFRGQLLVAIFVGLASMLGLYVVGLPYWAVVGLVAGLFNLVPLIGPFIGAIPALFIAFTTSSADAGLFFHPRPGWSLAVASGLVLLIVQQIDNHIISPNVVARSVKLHPITVILSLLAGGTLLGLWGMLLAVPVVASAKIFLLHAWDTRATWPPAAEEAPGAPAEGGPLPDVVPGDGADGTEVGDRTGPPRGRWANLRDRLRARGRSGSSAGPSSG